MDSLEEIGALLGFVAFAGLAVLVFLTFQQARHVRRLRDWAGRAPERAAAEAAREAGEQVPEEAEPETRERRTLIRRRPKPEPAQAAAPVAPEADRPQTGEQGAYTDEHGAYTDEHGAYTGEHGAYTDEGPPVPHESRLTMMRHDWALRFEEFDRRSPVDAKFLFAGVAVIIVGLAIATGGFGLVGGSDDSSSSGGSGNSTKQATAPEDKPVKVAVLNGTAEPGGVGVPGVADSVSKDVEAAGFKVGDVGDAGSFTSSVIMWRGDAESDADELADAMTDLLGDTEVLEMTEDIEPLAGKADVALIVGMDDSGA